MVKGTSRMRARVCASKRLAAAGGADQHDVGLGELDVAVLAGLIDALVVIVDGDREHLLGVALADDVIVQHLEDLLRGRHALLGFHEGGLVLLPDDLHAEFDAFVADEDGRARNELADLVLALAAEGAIERVLGLAAAGLTHLASGPSTGASCPLRSSGRSGPCCFAPCRRQPKHPRLPTFDHVSGGADQDLFNPVQVPEYSGTLPLFGAFRLPFRLPGGAP